MTHETATAAEPTKAITVTQQQALEILLVGGTQQQAADALGVARTTVSGAVDDATFMAALRQARTDLLKRSAARLHAATSIAVKALEDVAEDSDQPQCEGQRRAGHRRALAEGR